MSRYRVGERVKHTYKEPGETFPYEGVTGVITDVEHSDEMPALDQLAIRRDDDGKFFGCLAFEVSPAPTPVAWQAAAPVADWERDALALANDEAPDVVNEPPHYLGHPSGIECIEVTRHMGFCLGNAVKYIWRADLKGEATEDLRKAIKYLEFELERIEDERAGAA